MSKYRDERKRKKEQEVDRNEEHDSDNCFDVDDLLNLIKNTVPYFVTFYIIWYIYNMPPMF